MQEQGERGERVFARGSQWLRGGGTQRVTTSATGHDAFAQIANANAGFGFVRLSILSLSLSPSMGFSANGKHKLVSPATCPFPCTSSSHSPESLPNLNTY